MSPPCHCWLFAQLLGQQHCGLLVAMLRSLQQPKECECSGRSDFNFKTICWGSSAEKCLYYAHREISQRIAACILHLRFLLCLFCFYHSHSSCTLSILQPCRLDPQSKLVAESLPVGILRFRLETSDAAEGPSNLSAMPMQTLSSPSRSCQPASPY